MYAIGPPDRGGPGPVRIRAAARRVFDRPPDIAGRPGHRDHLREYLSDLVRPYRLDLREEVLGNGAGHSYGEMAAGLIGELLAVEQPDQPVELVVLAFAIPDVRPGRATATYLSQLCPGSPLAFAICDQGAAAAYTGLRLVGEYARAGACHRALLLVVEQAALPYDAGLPVEVPAGHIAVGLLCDRTGPALVRSVRQHPDVRPDRVAELLASELAEAGAGHPDLRVIADPHLAGQLAGTATAAAVRLAPAGRPHTGGWWDLAGALPAAGAPGGQRVVLAGYDRQLRYLCLSTIDIQPDR